MKIDIHVHTKKTKQGDANTREVDAKRFHEIVSSTDVQVIAITNHNVFDYAQYKEFVAEVDGDFQIWPGVELDIVQDDRPGHLIVISSPRKAQDLEKAIEDVSLEMTPDSFNISIEKVIEKFDHLDPLYVAHYKNKTPDLLDEDIDYIEANTSNKLRVLKEATNAVSAGIFISHGHASIYGSDVQNWNKYAKLSDRLPDLRLPVESFEHFCLLLEKDPTTINTLLDKKISDTLKLYPFDSKSEEIEVTAFNDITVVFGSKGTGKSCILNAISKHYSDKGIEASVFTPADDKLEDIYDLKGKDITLNLERFGINYCTDEILEVRSATEVDVTSIHNYLNYFRTKSSNRNAKKLVLKDLEQEETVSIQREFKAYTTSLEKVSEFIDFLERDINVSKELGNEELEQILRLLSNLNKKLKNGHWEGFSKWKQISFLNSAIEIFRQEVSRKTGTPSKPTNTGFREYALNRISIEVNTREIIKNMAVNIEKETVYVGSLGIDKGQLDFETEVKIQDGSVRDSSLSCIKGMKKGAQKKFSTCIKKINSSAYTETLFQLISDLNELDDVDDIKTINELILFKRYFSIDGQRYSPSSGETSMLMLSKELDTEKDVYILDEPERSLGNDYINDVIVPLLKEKAKQGKRIFISTHDANIAVRTLPYSSIYRCHSATGYETYSGNPFSNNLVNTSDTSKTLDWKKISMKTLEGGEEAFGERGKIYGSG